MKYTRVRRAVSAVVIDSWDEDRNPEHVKVNGNVTFTPLLKDGDVVQWAGPNGPESLVLAPIQCRISDGIIMHRGGEGIYLAAGGKGCEPSLIQWKAEFSGMQAGGWSFKLKPVMFDSVPDGEVDLTMVAPVAGASEPIVRGPAGTGIDNIKVDGAELVITARSEAGVFEMARIPLEDVVRAEAEAAAKSAADKTSSNLHEIFNDAANRAKGSATAAHESQENASAKADEATAQAVNAENSANQAKASETNAAGSASEAKSSASAASLSEENAGKLANSASNSAKASTASKDAASKSESSAADFAHQAEQSATNAKNDADRAANIANSTSWNGDKLTVNGKTSPSLTGPKGEPGEDGKSFTFDDLTEQQRESLRGEPGSPGEPGADGASNWDDIAGKPVSFPAELHTHAVEDISGLPDISQTAEPNALVQRGDDGAITVPKSATQDDQAVSKEYVDSEVDGKADKFHSHSMNDIEDLPQPSAAGNPGSMVVRGEQGSITVPKPEKDGDAAPKSYVDSGLASKADANHRHGVSDIDGMDAYATRQHTHRWQDITGAPAVPEIRRVSSAPTTQSPNVLYVIPE